MNKVETLSRRGFLYQLSSFMLYPFLAQLEKYVLPFPHFIRGTEGDSRISLTFDDGWDPHLVAKPHDYYWIWMFKLPFSLSVNDWGTHPVSTVT